MDEMMQPHEPELNEAPARAVSRRAFFNRTRLAVLAVAGAAVFGIGISTAGVTASENDEEKAKEKKKSEPRDKDRETKEKEQESSGKSSEKKSSNSNSKKKTKNTNGDTGKKKKQQKNDPAASSPWGKYVTSGKDQYGCTDFKSQAEAQAVLRLAPKDPNNLDGNANGIACDGVDAYGDGISFGLMPPPFDFTPVARK